MSLNLVPVLVCTDKRAVVFGFMDSSLDPEQVVIKGSLTLYNARNVFQWGTTRGLYELCATGPTKRSKVGATAPSVVLAGIHTIFTLTEQAVEAFDKATWDK